MNLISILVNFYLLYKRALYGKQSVCTFNNSAEFAEMAYNLCNINLITIKRPCSIFEDEIRLY